MGRRPPSRGSLVIKKPSRQAKYLQCEGAPRWKSMKYPDLPSSFCSSSLTRTLSDENKKTGETRKAFLRVLESTARIRSAAKKLDWLCSPELTGSLCKDSEPWSCSKCARSASNPFTLYDPVGAPCRARKAGSAPATSAHRRDVLIGLGILHGQVSKRTRITSDTQLSEYLQQIESPVQEPFRCTQCDFTLDRKTPYFAAERQAHLRLHGDSTDFRVGALSARKEYTQALSMKARNQKTERRYGLWNEQKPDWACSLSSFASLGPSFKPPAGTSRFAATHCKHCKRFSIAQNLAKLGCPALAHLYPSHVWREPTPSKRKTSGKRKSASGSSNRRTPESQRLLSSDGRAYMHKKLMQIWYTAGKQVDDEWKELQHRQQQARYLRHRFSSESGITPQAPQRKRRQC